jgi:hypothetical protein
MDVQEVGGGRGDWMDLAQDRDRWRALVSMAWHLQGRKFEGRGMNIHGCGRLGYRSVSSELATAVSSELLPPILRH